MKKIIVFLLFCVACVPSFSQKVSRSEAEQFAIEYLTQRDGGVGKKSTLKIVDSKNFNKLSNLRNIHIVETESNGWVAVSADKRATPVLAFGEGMFLSADSMPPAMVALFEEYEAEIQFIKENIPNEEILDEWNMTYDELSVDNNNLENAKGSAIYTPGEFLLQDAVRGGENNWNQTGPTRWENGKWKYYYDYIYNKFCPEFQGNNYGGYAPTGCTATAMAQIMWYWKWPYAAYIPNSIDNNGNPSDDSSLHQYNWDRMPSEIRLFQTPLEEVDAIAGFLRDCGYAAHMEYGADGSGASQMEAKTAFEDRFRYQVKSHKYKALTLNWASKLRDEINAGRPVLYSGYNSESGHSFVVDGYDSEGPDKFHINWGHGSQATYNIWCKLDNLNPHDKVYYNSRQEALLGIQPVYDSSISIDNRMISLNPDLPVYAVCSGDMTLNTVWILSSGSLICHAGNSIRLTTGTRIYQGGYFHGSIRPFPNPYLSNTDINMLSIDYDDGELEFADKLSEQAKSQPIQIYPNPASDIVNISSPLPISNVRLINLQGKELAIFSDKSNCISLSGLDNGLYFLEITFDDGLQ
uniref:Spi protease inhibitor domain-containing protein n=1 Tax=uncultured prokaryote TaxID=198431 RepID=A0A0H5PZ21_9ZZZZ|nr:hypothetical protein [uncultured prokaryote]